MEKVQLVITDQDRKNYASIILDNADNNSLIPLSDVLLPSKSILINESIDLPRLPTIGDMKFEGGLTKSDEDNLIQLIKSYPKAIFDNITPKEAETLKEYSKVTQSMDRKDIWGIIEPYFSSVFDDELGDKLSKMKEIQKRNNNDPLYTPTMEWIEEISRRIIHVRKDLFRYNIDFNARAFDYREKPIDFLLMLIKAQKEMYPKRNKKISNTFFSKFQLIIQSHSELMIKLKLIGKKGDDFYGSRYNKIRDDLRVLKHIMYGSLNGKPLTIKQQSRLINIIDDYKSALELVFISDSDDKNLFDKSLDRPDKNLQLAALEIYYTFDDTNVPDKNNRISNFRMDNSSCEIINSIFTKPKEGKSLRPAFKNGISMPNLEEYITQYFSFDNLNDRYIIRQKAQCSINSSYKKIVDLFFDILNKYMIL